MEIHRNDMVGAGASEKVRNQSTGLSDPLAVSDLRLKGWGLGNGGLASQSARRLRAAGAVGAVGAVVAVEVGSLVSLDAVGLDRACRIRGDAVALVELHLAELVVQRCRAICETGALRLAWVRRLGVRVERVGAGPGAARDLGQRGARLVVGNVRLARVGEEGEHGGDALRRGGSACRDGDEKSGVRQALDSTIP